jgi:MFS transporter, SP family, sugar:H+ symporter
MFSNNIRVSALSIAAAMQWVANFVVSTTFPPLLQYFGLGSAYGLYTIAAAISIFFVAFFIKETNGIELEKM